MTYYQTKIDIDTKKIVGAEALVRWNHRERGLLSPSEFVPIFEKNGFIMEIDFYVYESTCKYLKKIMDNNEKLIPISCNFSRRHLSNPTFVESLNEILNKYGIPAELIEIELTETMATENFDKFTEVVNKLKVSGYKISIDDFGSGYSSVQLLYDLPIDVLKLDKSFIQKMNENTMEDEIITSVIDICHKHDIKIICEGVETLEQEEYVRNHHCKLVQGYLYSKPIDESSFDKYRRNNS